MTVMRTQKGWQPRFSNLTHTYHSFQCALGQVMLGVKCPPSHPCPSFLASLKATTGIVGAPITFHVLLSRTTLIMSPPLVPICESDAEHMQEVVENTQSSDEEGCDSDVDPAAYMVEGGLNVKPPYKDKEDGRVLANTTPQHKSQPHLPPIAVVKVCLCAGGICAMSLRAVVWYGVVLCVVVWYGVPLCGVVWCGVVW